MAVFTVKNRYSVVLKPESVIISRFECGTEPSSQFNARLPSDATFLAEYRIIATDLSQIGFSELEMACLMGFDAFAALIVLPSDAEVAQVHLLPVVGAFQTRILGTVNSKPVCILLSVLGSLVYVFFGNELLATFRHAQTNISHSQDHKTWAITFRDPGDCLAIIRLVDDDGSGRPEIKCYTLGTTRASGSYLSFDGSTAVITDQSGLYVLKDGQVDQLDVATFDACLLRCVHPEFILEAIVALTETDVLVCLPDLWVVGRICRYFYGPTYVIDSYASDTSPATEPELLNVQHKFLSPPLLYPQTHGSWFALLHKPERLMLVFELEASTQVGQLVPTPVLRYAVSFKSCSKILGVSWDADKLSVVIDSRRSTRITMEFSYSGLDVSYKHL